MNYLEQTSIIYKQELLENILPFWLKNGIDHVNGGYFTCLDRDGSLMDTTKSVWFQGRFAYVLAYAYNHIEENKNWLQLSKSGIDFLEKHCFDTDGRMFFEVSAEGVPLRKRRYLFSETFAIAAMAEYAIAANDYSYAQKALDLFKLVLKYKNTPGLVEPKYLENLQMKGHSICMILINTASVLRRAIQDPILDMQIEDSIHEIRKDFIKPQFNALLETVGLNGEYINSNMGRCINPGHCMETAWFILEEAKHRNWDKLLVKSGTQIIDWSWDWGWDMKYGGIVNFRDCQAFPPQDYSQDMKFWWPQAETIIASLYAFLATGDYKYIEMHRKIHDYTFKHFPDKKYGEWYGYLHRDGTVAQPAKGNIFKGPFHIPRMLIKAHLLINEIEAKYPVLFHTNNLGHRQEVFA